VTGTRPRVSVVIVAARRADRLEGCLAALARALDESAHPAEVVIVLNGADAEVRGLAARTTGAVLVDAAVGLGFADGANLGVAASAGELVLLLHDDAEPRAGWLDPLVAILDETAVRSHRDAVEAVAAHERVHAELQALRARLGDQ